MASGFDAHRPPDPGVLDDCVHCGFCLPACPTYQLWGEEADSPRGRIWLMHLANEGAAEVDEIVPHLDACLGCMACVTACPSGVRYDELIESARAQVERNHTRTLVERLTRRAIFALFPYPRRLRVAAVLLALAERLGALRLARRLPLPAGLAALVGVAPPVRFADLRQRVPAVVAAEGVPRLRVGLLTGCVQSVFFARANAATARVLAAEGCEVVAPRAESGWSGCCGALEVHAGSEPAALARAKATIAAFEAADVERVVTNAAGCGSTLKDYGRLLADDAGWAARAGAFAARAVDVTELLAELEPRAPRHPIPARVAYHDACHLAHAQQVRAAPRSLLRAVPELELAELAEADLCCGSAGVYNLLQPEPAAELGRRKATHVRAVAPELVASANPGCLLQLRRHLDADGAAPRLVHPIELLDASIRGVQPGRG